MQEARHLLGLATLALALTVSACGGEESGAATNRAGSPAEADPVRATPGGTTGAAPAGQSAQDTTDPVAQVTDDPGPIDENPFPNRVRHGKGWRHILPKSGEALIAAEKLLSGARAARRAADFPREFRLLNQAVAACGDHRHALYERGLAHMRAKRLTDAIRDFDAALALDPLFAAVYDDRGLAYWHSGNPGKALADFAAGARIDPEIARWYADTYLGAATTQEAYLKYTAHLKKHPKDSIARVRLVAALSWFDDLQLAQRELPSMLENLSTHAPARLLAAGIWNSQGDVRLAIMQLSEAVRLDPKLAGAWALLAELQYSSGQWRAAESSALAAIRERPDVADGETIRAVTRLTAGDVDGFFRALDRAWDLDPRHFPLHSPLVRRMIDSWRHWKNAWYRPRGAPANVHAVAEGLFGWGSDWLPPTRMRILSAAAALGRQNDAPAEALVHWTDVINASPNPRAYLNRALIAAHAGRNADALADLAAASKLAPSYNSPYHNRGWLYARLGRHRSALAEYCRSLYLSPDDHLSRGNRAKLLRQLGENAWAQQDEALIER